MKHVIAHPLSQEHAKRVLDEAYVDYARRFHKYAPRLQWLSADQARVSIHALGVQLEGTVRVFERGLEVELEVPFLMRPFVGRAKQAIEREVARLVTAFQARG